MHTLTQTLDKITRVLTLPPIVTGLTVLLLYVPCRAMTLRECLLSELFLLVIPALAYPLRELFHIGSDRRSGQRAMAFVFSGAGYAAGGQTLSGVAWTLAGTSAALAAADPSWTEASITARYALIYVAKTVAGRTNPLVCLLDFGADRGVTGGTFSVRFDASGVLALE